ncbi:hypothetical protein H5410_049504 [Solanum commersonii]|uniref:Uncharacterized protein n=1 Tax=Solanum commersonii TaxID=4109 RepID=A0A9J5WUC6_SOLCO|nr:hypothetical protein H5410_049504 [Solanum commersonii]
MKSILLTMNIPINEKASTSDIDTRFEITKYATFIHVGHNTLQVIIHVPRPDVIRENTYNPNYLNGKVPPKRHKKYSGRFGARLVLGSVGSGEIAKAMIRGTERGYAIQMLFLDIITMQQKHIGEMCSMTILKNRDYQSRGRDYLENVGFHKWSRAYFREACVNFLTSSNINIAGSQQLFKRISIISLFNDISKRWSEKFHERRMAYAKLKTTFVPSAETKIMANKNLGNKLLVHQIDEDTLTSSG